MKARCAHHWIAAYPDLGVMEAAGHDSSVRFSLPAVLEGIDLGLAAEERRLPGVATAVGGVRPSSVAALSSSSRS